MMADPQKLMNGLIEKNQELAKINDELKDLAQKKAEAEKEYRLRRMEWTLKLRQSGTAVTIIKDIVKGKVAEEKFDFDVADETYKIKKDKAKDLRTAIDTYRSLLTWEREEYNRTNYQEG